MALPSMYKRRSFACLSAVSVSSSTNVFCGVVVIEPAVPFDCDGVVDRCVIGFTPDCQAFGVPLLRLEEVSIYWMRFCGSPVISTKRRGIQRINGRLANT